LRKTKPLGRKEKHLGVSRVRQKKLKKTSEKGSDATRGGEKKGKKKTTGLSAKGDEGAKKKKTEKTGGETGCRRPCRGKRRQFGEQKKTQKGRGEV